MQTSNKPTSKLAVYIHGTEQKIGPICYSQESAAELCRNIFPTLVHATKVGFYAMDLDLSEDPTEICADAWIDVKAKKMVVVDHSKRLAEIQGKYSMTNQCMIETMTGKTLTVNGSFDIAELKERIRQLDGTPVDLQQCKTFGRLRPFGW